MGAAREDAMKDPTERILAMADAMAPCSHLAVWSYLRGDFPELHPAEVWRTLVTCSRYQRDASSGTFKRIDVVHPG